MNCKQRLGTGKCRGERNRRSPFALAVTCCSATAHHISKNLQTKVIIPIFAFLEDPISSFMRKIFHFQHIKSPTFTEKHRRFTKIKISLSLTILKYQNNFVFQCCNNKIFVFKRKFASHIFFVEIFQFQAFYFTRKVMEMREIPGSKVRAGRVFKERTRATQLSVSILT